MDMISENNYTRLCGHMAGPPVYSHSSRGQDFYSFPLEIRRLSGNTDTVNIVLHQEKLAALEPGDAEKLCVTGQLRSFNNRRGQGAKTRHYRLCQRALLLRRGGYEPGPSPGRSLQRAKSPHDPHGPGYMRPDAGSKPALRPAQTTSPVSAGAPEPGRQPNGPSAPRYAWRDAYRAGAT